MCCCDILWVCWRIFLLLYDEYYIVSRIIGASVKKITAMIFTFTYALCFCLCRWPWKITHGWHLHCIKSKVVLWLPRTLIRASYPATWLDFCITKVPLGSSPKKDSSSNLLTSTKNQHLPIICYWSNCFQPNQSSLSSLEEYQYL